MDVVADILEVASCPGGIVKTRLMCGAYLNRRMFKRYIPFLLEEGLIEVNSGLYEATRKGKEFLSHYWRARRAIARANETRLTRSRIRTASPSVEPGTQRCADG